jgi:ATP-dependent protease ClpP protease subunit
VLRTLSDDGFRARGELEYRERILPPCIAAVIGNNALELTLVDGTNGVSYLSDKMINAQIEQLGGLRPNEGILVTISSHGGNRSSAEVFAREIQSQAARVAVLGLNVVCSSAFDVFMSFAADRRFSLFHTRFLAHHSQAELQIPQQAIDVKKKTIGGMSEIEWQQRASAWFREHMQSERAYAKRWQSLAKQLGFASALDFLRAERYISAVTAQELGIVKELIVSFDPPPAS